MAGQRRAAGQGQHGVRADGAARAARGRRVGLQAARGLGHDAGGDRRVPARRRRARRAGGDPHRHAQRGRLRAESTLAAIAGRTIHTYHTEGAGGGHAPDIITVVLAAQRAAVVDQPDAPAHGQHRRRAPRHADGVPPPQPVDPRGPRVRREPHPAVDDRRRGRAPRPRRDLDDRLRLAGDGPHRRGGAAHLADRARDEAAPRRAARRRRGRQPAGPALRGQVHDLPGDRPRARRRDRLGRGRQARRPRAVGPGVLRGAPARSC